jgi:hypothetical protein
MRKPLPRRRRAIADNPVHNEAGFENGMNAARELSEQINIQLERIARQHKLQNDKPFFVLFVAFELSYIFSARDLCKSCKQKFMIDFLAHITKAFQADIDETTRESCE